ncbi:MAG TPA: lipopolysaccharide assembly protein LapA domain-containing protein [Xanthobacteraceae bacterium]
MLRKIVTAAIVVPLAIIIIALAMANRQTVTVSVDPFSASAPAASVTLPLFALIIVLLIVGVLIGGAATWLGQGKWRRAARRWQREVSGLRSQVAAFADTAQSANLPHESAPPPRLKLRSPLT